MNVSYKDISTVDAAKMLGVDKTTVAGWCRGKIINFQDVSDGNSRARYLISEEEIEYLRTLFKKFGKRKAMQHYRKDWKEGRKPAPVKEKVDEVTAEQPVEIQQLPEPIVEEPIKKPNFNDEGRLLDAVLNVREVKERIQNLKAELAQLENEYQYLKQDIIDWL